MIGAIIGDIVGSRFEFNNTDDLNFELFTDECSFTDDSICTLAIAYALVSGISYEESLRFWCSSYPNPMGAYGGSFARWLASSNPKPYNSFGNGSAMRVSPVAWWFDNLDDVQREAEQTALPTHNHPEGIKGERGCASPCPSAPPAFCPGPAPPGMRTHTWRGNRRCRWSAACCPPGR